MKQVVVKEFGGLDKLKLLEAPTPQPGPGQVCVRLTSIGMNHADLMARRGHYKLSSGDPPFTPGLEGGGVIEARGPDVQDRHVGQRVLLGAEAPRLEGGSGTGGTYRTHYVCPASMTIPAPDSLPNIQLGSLWLAYLTAWGCLAWKQRVQPGNFVAMPAASSAVALAASQIVHERCGITIGLTTSPDKIQRITSLPGHGYDHLVLTRDDSGPRPWHQDIKRITGSHGVDVYFDPVAAGDYLTTEIRSLAQHGVVWVYGLLGQVGPVDVQPLIRKHGSVRGWALAELIAAGPTVLHEGYSHILEGFAKNVYRQHVDRVFKLDQVQAAHEYMEQGVHIGKLVLQP